ncbi:lytic polysaccharide monooxygenase [Streptomyces niveiscabiei]|uniref:lytic polysaccharide monooxygenase n=1 Tax=Streptomyces niveiscabiei TaxID=164115 RepID=UPI0029AA934C|nr:lytic polysaccharide monooxygenase [Streptomyces niveiscabiei]MDX3379940.1 lytic polysaccharide monooxygenase [Streptomyces niveiscabiei]
MFRHRLAPLTAAVLGTLAVATGPAVAHGAPTTPVSRVYACSPEGGANAGTAACRAAVRANGASFAAWDNLRVAGVNGRDRRTIPDGELCSGGLPAYRGLDLARDDWPATQLRPGATLRMTYASTIPHTGSFKLYLTEPGYDPAKPLTWSELPSEPFAVVKDPQLSNGAYRFSAKLPADRTGRQVLYTIWQNTSTADTYYSCSDVVFPEAAQKEAAQKEEVKGEAAQKDDAPKEPARKETPAPAPAPAPGPATASAPAAASPDSTPVAKSTGSGPSAPVLAGGAAAILLLAGGTALFTRLRRG